MSTNERRVGASVIPSAPVPAIPGPVVGPGIPPPPIYPMMLYDDRYRRCNDDSDDETERDVAVAADITRHNVAASSTITVGLTSASISTGEARVSGNALVLPRRGEYRVHVNITLVTAGETVSVLVNGGVGGGNIISTSATGTSVYMGTVRVRASSHNERVSILVSNGGSNAIQVLGGTVSAQLI